MIVPSRSSVESFNHYYTIRSLYGELGASSYQANYERMLSTQDPTTNMTFQDLCSLFLQDHCLPSIDLSSAKKHLLQHADNAYSSVNTAGLPFPFFGGENENVRLFGGTVRWLFCFDSLNLSIKKS